MSYIWRVFGTLQILSGEKLFLIDTARGGVRSVGEGDWHDRVENVANEPRRIRVRASLKGS